MPRAISLFLICTILSGIYTSDGRADTHIKVAAIQIPLMVESPTKGVFIELLQEISKRSDITFDITVYPGKRAHRAFLGDEVDMLIPFPKGNRSKVGILTTPIYTKRDFVFVRKGQPIPKTLEQLKGMRLGITAHYKYDPSLYTTSGIHLETAQSDMDNVRKLKAKRLDGFLVEEQSGLAALEKITNPNIEYDRNNPIFSYDVVILLKTNKEGQQHAEKSISS
ncbi:transporter substrate-binding domain-containing protein [Terasakiella sp. A23]|uniref:substrate-binding periplasmic protein n=1 Tax=Terasakiella sp. FCG-A23 TaxID=3080561 RepID=UPI00295389DB|nr:transporter substrate-binding domain-containing protein [Terasakiella sp. A23]MDV7338093.1 transporter substrate-binding domain-containing protein [Terasakiella sp. A23]